MYKTLLVLKLEFGKFESIPAMQGLRVSYVGIIYSKVMPKAQSV